MIIDEYKLIYTWSILFSGITFDYSFKIEWVRAIWKSDSKLQDIKQKRVKMRKNQADGIVKLDFGRVMLFKNGNPLKIQFYFQNNITVPNNTFSKALQ